MTYLQFYLPPDNLFLKNAVSDPMTQRILLIPAFFTPYHLFFNLTINPHQCKINAIQLSKQINDSWLSSFQSTPPHGRRQGRHLQAAGRTLCFNPRLTPFLVSARVDAFKHNAAIGGEPVFQPHLLHMDQGAPPLAKADVLQDGKGQEFIFGIHRFFINTIDMTNFLV
jgi:hypothetical protein